MVSVDKINKGVAAYLDSELMSKIEVGSVQKVIIGVGVSLLIKKSEEAVIRLSENPVIKMMEVIDDNGNIDVDSIRTELKEQIGKNGLKIDLPIVGTMTFHESDVDLLYKYIMEA